MLDKVEKIEKLLERIEEAYLDCRKSNPQYPSPIWIEDEKLIPFSMGNIKLPPTTYIINLGSSKMCPGRLLGTCRNANICYADKAETRFKEGCLSKRLLQTIRWRQLSAEDIASQMLDKSARAHKNKMQYLRFNESGDVFDEEDIKKMSDIADILSEHGIGTYTYTSRYDLDWSEKSKNLIVNGSGFMVDNNFITVDRFTDNMVYQCHGNCDECDFCKKAGNVDIYVEVH